ncbi:MAG TPA: hypothetical protein VFV67_33635 [Actinophytocola sp.]|uniref:hypothetical protein n=1 Tax=Actinophytocola sp. TaxID=1872138 RepID=UPI002DB7258C|nr:hypothetical protein [Actinophytocola sp.]HEU5475611.1 hypothetical protein [Actinophytocola sp.]
MSASRAVLISAKIAALAGSIFIAIAAPTTGLSVAVADDGGTNQPPPSERPDGNSWGG